MLFIISKLIKLLQLNVQSKGQPIRCISTHCFAFFFNFVLLLDDTYIRYDHERSLGAKSDFQNFQKRVSSFYAGLNHSVHIALHGSL